MLRLVGISTLTLVIAYVVLQQGSAKRLSEGGNVLTNALSRLLSPDVPLIRNRNIGDGTTTTPAPHAGDVGPNNPGSGAGGKTPKPSPGTAPTPPAAFRLGFGA